MSSMSKSKGNKAENDVLRMCREIYPDAYRTIGSGNSSDDLGDLIFKQYMIEVKHHKDLTDKQIEDFFLKVEKESENRNKIPLLVYKKNRRKWKVMFRLSDNYFAWMYFEDFLEREGKKK